MKIKAEDTFFKSLRKINLNKNKVFFEKLCNEFLIQKSLML